MSKIVCASAIDGAAKWISLADIKLDRAIQEKGESQGVCFPNTAYYLPVIYSLSGKKVETLSDCREALRLAKQLLPERPSDSLWLPYLGKALDAGVAALYACEIIEACKYALGPNPADGIWLGAADDVIMRERGIEFVDGTAPGFAAITGAAPTNEIAVNIARELQEKNLYVFMAGCTNGKQFAQQLSEEGIQLGWETRLVPFGEDVSALIYALGFANRAALSFGGVLAGDYKANLAYNKNRIFAFVLALGEVSPEKYSVAAGAINYGFPVIADTEIPQILPTGVCTYEHVVSEVPYENMVERALEVRGCKIKITKVPIPVPYGAAFEGERIRKADVHAEFGGNKTTAFEFVSSVSLEDIEDGAIEVIGPDIDQVEEGSALPLAIWVEVAGRKMQSDFEPILERQIHHLLNGAEGLWHMGQREIIWTRISKTGFKNGLRLKHYGEILHAKLLSDYPAIVDKVKVTLITDAQQVEDRLTSARRIYDERNRRLEEMTDDASDTFYSCLLCQSFAPNHVCIITPERLGLCGAYNWLDGKAAYEIDHSGPNQPISKGECLDPVKGMWKGVNDYVYSNSHKTISSFCAYSIMDQPMTSCGCFEAICAYLPECNGVMVVNREFPGETPVGMTFSTLAGMVGGGQQTPGFMGVGKVFLTSRKFLHAEGGFKRLVWMPKELKELLSADLQKRFEEQGVPDLLPKVADETVCVEAHQLREFMERMAHPALEMEDMSSTSEDNGAQPEASPTERDLAVDKQSREPLTTPSAAAVPTSKTEDLSADVLALIENQVASQLTKHLGSSELQSEIVQGVVDALRGKGPAPQDKDESTNGTGKAKSAPTTEHSHTTAAERLKQVSAFEIPKDSSENPVWQVKLGASKAEGGTRGVTYRVGGASCMPFHLWEGEMPQRPLVAMEVFDSVNRKFPESLRTVYGELLEHPAEMAKVCVDSYGADLISVRLEGTHPEKGNRSAEDAVKLVGQVLTAVEVPLIITGHNHYEQNNQVLKAVAQAYAGENLLLNWVEQDNYRTIAGAALAYGHAIVAQSPIDVNIGKQLNILLNNMDIKQEQIVIDPMTGAVGYGIEYTYSVMERIRLSGLGGDTMLAGPMIVSPGQECAKIKEYKAPESSFPSWGDVSKRGAFWELSTAISLLYAGADILILYHPDAAQETKKTILKLLDEGRG